jgi:hemerythrin-like domain-containing protein
MPDDPTQSASLSRRRLLTAGGIGIAIGVVGTELGNVVGQSSPAESSPAVSNVTPPDVDLMQEHGVLKRVLLIYQESIDRITTGQPAPMSEIHAGALIIHDFIEGFHEALEEGYVFPALKAAGQLVATVDTLLLQHARGRQLTQLILTNSTNAKLSEPATRGQTAAAVTAFVTMYQPHEAREDTVVFPAFRALLGPSRLNDLAATFAHLQIQQFGADAFTATVNQVAAIEKTLDIYDLNQFTPAAVSS